MKKHYPIIYFPPAEKDLEHLFDYIQRDSPTRASAFLDKIDRSISRLAYFPLSGHNPRDKRLRKKGYRILVVENYLVFYHTEKKRVIIDRILHGKRRYGFLF